LLNLSKIKRLNESLLLSFFRIVNKSGGFVVIFQAFSDALIRQVLPYFNPFLP
jgi:hypothetical protein